MRAAFGVQAAFGHAQALDGPAGDEVLGNDGLCILRMDIAVPDRIGIDHNHRAVLALIEASGLINADAAGQPGLPDEMLQTRVKLAFPIAGAGWAGSVERTNIVTDKDVPFKPGQTDFLLHQSKALAGWGRSFQNHTAKPARICENESLTMSSDNLVSLKDDMVAFIEGHGLRRLPGFVTDDGPSVLWEGKGNPDAWKDFVEMAKHVGAPFVTISEVALEREEVDSLVEEAGEMNFPDEEASELVEAKWLRKYAGMLGYIQLGFVYQGIVFLHETTTEWYERYQTLLEDIESFQDIVIDDAHHHSDEDE
jgi:hypothetical protein